jgi:hypothetical protein
MRGSHGRPVEEFLDYLKNNTNLVMTGVYTNTKIETTFCVLRDMRNLQKALGILNGVGYAQFVENKIG